MAAVKIISRHWWRVDVDWFSKMWLRCRLSFQLRRVGPPSFLFAKDELMLMDDISRDVDASMMCWCVHWCHFRLWRHYWWRADDYFRLRRRTFRWGRCQIRRSRAADMMCQLIDADWLIRQIKMYYWWCDYAQHFIFKMWKMPMIIDAWHYAIIDVLIFIIFSKRCVAFISLSVRHYFPHFIFSDIDAEPPMTLRRIIISLFSFHYCHMMMWCGCRNFDVTFIVIADFRRWFSFFDVAPKM